LALRSVASVHKSWGRFQESVGYYRKAATMAEAADLPDQEAGAHGSLGWLYMDTWQPDLALGEFKRVSVLDTISPQGALQQAYALVRLQRADEARRILEDVRNEWQGRLDSTQMNTEKYAIEGYIALENKDYKSALDYYQQTRKGLNDTTAWRGSIAEALIGLGRYDDALKELRQLRTESERNWISTEYLRGLYSEADALVKLGRNNEAIAPLQRLMVFWGNADWDVPWLNDAKRLYASLTAQ